MKICWEHLDHLVLMPRGNLSYYEDTKNILGFKGTFFVSERPCVYCGKLFLKKLNYKAARFCDAECRHKYSLEKEEKRVVQEKLDRRVFRQNNPLPPRVYKTPWNKGMALPKDLMLYSTYSPRISWFVETRKDPNDERILQTRCCICNNWFSPTLHRLILILNFVMGKEPRKSSWGFYCSDECKNKCPHFGKHVEHIMRQDYLNSGRARYSEVHNIPDHILYYDWQTELKEQINKQQKELIGRNRKTKLRRQLRRRKKSELEKRLMAKRRQRKKIKKEKREARQRYLKSDEYKRDHKLKRLMYFTTVRAKEKGWQHDIDFEWLKTNTPDDCPKCGIPFEYNADIKLNPFAPSIDRKDRSKGYTKDNCEMTSWIYNCGKNAYDEETLYIICKAFLDNLDHDST